MIFSVLICVRACAHVCAFEHMCYVQYVFDKDKEPVNNLVLLWTDYEYMGPWALTSNPPRHKEPPE